MSSQLIEVTADDVDKKLILQSMQQQQQSMLPQVCQICGLLLKIDNSLEKLSDAQLKQLNCSLAIRDDIDTVTSMSDADMEMSVSANLLDGGGGGVSQLSSEKPPSNIYLEQQQYVNMKQSASARNLLYACNISMADSVQLNSNTNDLLTGWSNRINTTSALFDIMSTNTDIDHPLCEECAELLLNQLDTQFNSVEKEKSEYTELIKKLNQQTVTQEELSDLENELKSLQMEEEKLLKQLEICEMEESKLNSEIKKKLDEEIKINEQEEKYLIDYCTYQRHLIELEESQVSLDNQLKHTKQHFDYLRTTNVLNATFHIWHSGAFGTINYFRLGRLPDTPVEWDEINAGLGQVTLLLHSLARKIKLEFKRFKLVPYGNYSFIQALENVSFSHLNVKKDEKLHMYGVGGFKYYLEWDKKFDTGMVAFLDCLQQLEEKIKTVDASFSFPYPINGYKLEDKKTTSTYSIKCHFNSYEEWTKALKYMLTNLKWSLAWVVSQSQP